MTFDVAHLKDPNFFAQNRRPAHSDHRWFASVEEARTGISSFEQFLNGHWKFHYAKNFTQLPTGFQDPALDVSGWDDIRVPQHIQLAGYDRPQYVNVGYAWDGQEAVLPGEIPTRDNPVGTYIRDFELDHQLEVGERLHLTFHGAESAVAVWVNGTYIGYASDTFTPSEFDITNALTTGINRVAAQVFTYTAGSWLEDQDFYRFSGIFRDVVLTRRAAVHLEDVRITTELSDTFDRAIITITPQLAGVGTVNARIAGVGEFIVGADGVLTFELTAPLLWSAEQPNLYDVVLEVRDASGALTEIVPQRVGVRRFEIVDSIMLLNGKRVAFHGVNRHEFGLNGRVVTRSEVETDVKLMKQVGINAVRTSHYPNNRWIYEFADEYGLMVIDEMNLETHGMWTRVRAQDRPQSEALPGDRDQWRAITLDRAASMLERDKNHASILIWSCGNESYGGTVIRDVSAYFKASDNRPVHYEGIDWDARYPETTDIVSKMYTPAAEVEAFLQDHREKPMILCEYAHAMGNSFGAVDEYVELSYREPLFQGGFIWDFADQAIELTDRHGKTIFGYGGDSGEAIHDWDFSGNGIFAADHTWTPKTQEVKRVYQSFVIEPTETEFTLQNRFLFTGSDAYEVRASLAREGVVITEGAIETSVAPGEQGTYPLPFAAPTLPGEYRVIVSVHTRERTGWAETGYEIAFGQYVYSVTNGSVPAIVSSPAPTLVEGINWVGVHGSNFHVTFSRLFHGLQSYSFGNLTDGPRELLTNVVRPNFWHAPTANERGHDGPFDEGQWVLASRYARTNKYHEMAPMVIEQSDRGVSVSYRYQLPTTPETFCDVTYLVDPTGAVEVHQRMNFSEDLPDLPEFAMLLSMPAEYSNLKWYGDGPDECYVDRRLGTKLDVYEAKIADLLTPYIKPQESGNRTGVRWAEITDQRGNGLRFTGSPTMEFSALPYTPFEIENANRPNDLPPVHRTIVRPALMRRGVAGDNSWGAKALAKYRIPNGELSFTFSFRGL